MRLSVSAAPHPPTDGDITLTGDGAASAVVPTPAAAATPTVVSVPVCNVRTVVPIDVCISYCDFDSCSGRRGADSALPRSRFRGFSLVSSVVAAGGTRL